MTEKSEKICGCNLCEAIRRSKKKVGDVPTKDEKGGGAMKLIQKYIVTKADGEPVDPGAKYFVLRYDADSRDGYAAREALRYYAYISNATSLFDDVNNEHEDALALKDAENKIREKCVSFSLLSYDEELDR